uniref:Uncharacterized protein n=1 Tax=viral metagenome TaxID=1070528 RepID=A0A6M3JMH6_9ZZZZ
MTKTRDQDSGGGWVGVGGWQKSWNQVMAISWQHQAPEGGNNQEISNLKTTFSGLSKDLLFEKKHVKLQS